MALQAPCVSVGFALEADECVKKQRSTPPSLAGLEMSVIAHVRGQAPPVTAGFDADSHIDSDAWGYTSPTRPDESQLFIW